MMPKRRPENPRGTEIYTAGEIERIFAALSQKSFAGLRNRAIIAAGLYAQLRISETLGLRPGDVDQEFRALWVRRGKGGKRRPVGLHPKGGAMIRDWMIKRKESGVDSVWLFCTRNGDQVKTRYIRQMLPRVGKKIGLGKRAHSHALRATGGTRLAHSGVNILHIQQQFGHSELKSTSTYLRGFSNNELVDAINNAEM